MNKSNNDTKFKIYAIICPSTDDVRYVGRTSREDVRVRIAEHISGSNYSNQELVSWLRSLKSAPKIAVLEECKGRTQSHDREMFWINRLLNEGHGLLNKNGLMATVTKMISTAPVMNLCNKVNGSIKKSIQAA